MRLLPVGQEASGKSWTQSGKCPFFITLWGFHIHETVTRRMCAFRQTPTCLGESIGRLTMTTHVSHVFQSRLVRNKTDLLISIHPLPFSRFSVTLWGESRSLIISLIDAQQLKISNLHRPFTQNVEFQLTRAVWSLKTLIWIWVLSFSLCIVLGKLFNLSVPQFPQLWTQLIFSDHNLSTRH